MEKVTEIKNGDYNKQFFYFIVLLRALATALITNTHFNNVYPPKYSFLAVGGLLGDALFFTISGFCLANIKKVDFFKWYGKRILRIYPTIFIIAIITLILGEYKLVSFATFFKTFIFPTRYHFIASIMLLYILFYFVCRFDFLKKRIPLIMIAVGIVWFTLYVFCFDKTHRLDIAQQPMSRFLFFETMLFGAYVQNNKDVFLNRNKVWKWISFCFSLALYIGLKIVIDKLDLKNYQFANIISIFLVCCAAITAFSGVENRLGDKKILNAVCGFLAPLTLEIYVVQHTVINLIMSIKQLFFPLNFILVLIAIILSAFVLNRVVNLIVKGFKKIFEVRKKTV